MPKIVDHEKQKKALAEAVWRVILRDGIERASVRNIAEEAGLSAGAMRHYFSTQSELLAFSMRWVAEKVTARIMALPRTGSSWDFVIFALGEMLPMDEERRAEMEVWFAFTAKSFADPALKPLREQVYEQMRFGIGSMIDALMGEGEIRSDLDRDFETERLFSLIDGLAIHAVMHPDQLTPDRLRSVVVRHLDGLRR